MIAHRLTVAAALVAAVVLPSHIYTLAEAGQRSEAQAPPVKAPGQVAFNLSAPKGQVNQVRIMYFAYDLVCYTSGGTAKHAYAWVIEKDLVVLPTTVIATLPTSWQGNTWVQCVPSFTWEPVPEVRTNPATGGKIYRASTPTLKVVVEPLKAVAANPASIQAYNRLNKDLSQVNAAIIKYGNQLNVYGKGHPTTMSGFQGDTNVVVKAVNTFGREIHTESWSGAGTGNIITLVQTTTVLAKALAQVPKTPVIQMQGWVEVYSADINAWNAAAQTLSDDLRDQTP